MRMHIVQTYDLSTKVGKLGIVGIHSPSTSLVRNLYSGFMSNFKRWKPVQCNMTMACASMLPADPLQVGVEAGDIAPQDMFNPILYKAVTSDSFDMILSRVRNSITGAAMGGSLTGSETIVELDNPFPNMTAGEHFGIYYGLLSMDGWRKAMPQAGLRMNALVPLVYPVMGTYGNVNKAGSGTPIAVNTAIIGSSGAGTQLGNASTGSYYFRGRPEPMPSFPTRFVDNSTGADTGASYWEAPIAYVGMLVLPPARLNVLYYRMRIDWEIEFYEPCTDLEMLMPGALNVLGPEYTYRTDYASVAKEMDNTTDLVDTTDADVELITTSSH